MLRIVRRSAFLVLIGVALNIFPFTTGPAYWRFPGVLQRIGLCYGIAAVLVLVVPQLRVLWLALLLLYWLSRSLYRRNIIIRL